MSLGCCSRAFHLNQPHTSQPANYQPQNIVFTDGVCTGSHGLSIGSVGGRSNNNVENVLFENSVVADSQNGRAP